MSTGSVGLAGDPDLHLLLPADDTESPYETIRIPLMNARLSIADLAEALK